jgi:drug/metabolite transporter (DMT)-like permease
MVTLAGAWGASFLFIKKAVQVFDPVQMAMWRMSMVTVIYIPIAIYYWPKINWKQWQPLAVVAFCGSAIPNFFFAIAQRHVNSGLAGALNSLTPLFTLLLGVLFFRMQATRQKVFGVFLGLLGALGLILFNDPHGAHSGSSNFWYAALCVLATVCYAINANSVNKHLRDMHPAAIGAAAFMITGVFFFAGLWWSDGWTVAFQHPDGLKALGYILYLALIGTAIGNVLYFMLLQRTNAIFATSVTYLLPITSIVLGFFDGESVGISDIVATGVILTGLYIARK